MDSLLSGIISFVGGLILDAMGSSSNQIVSGIGNGISSGAEKLNEACEKNEADLRKRASKMSDEQLKVASKNANSSLMRNICQQELDSRK